MSNTKHILIAGGGFCGVMTVMNLIRGSGSPFPKGSLRIKITIVHSGAPFINGVAYNTYSAKHLLNVSTGNMSAFPENTAHFTNWVHSRKEYSEYELNLLAQTFLPRNLYGEYLRNIWDATLASKRKDTELTILNDFVTDLELTENKTAKVILQKGAPLIADYVVLATGNALPRNPQIDNTVYYSSPTYFRNPWTVDSVSNLNPGGDVLIIGNGLTMVDTVIGLMEHGFRNKIYSVSLNGFGVLPYRHFGITYGGLAKEIKVGMELTQLFGIVNKHIKKVRKLGVSAGPVIDSLRPYSQQIWQSFTPREKKQFLSKLRYRWGVARHRLPVFIYDTIEKLRIEGRLEVWQGKLTDVVEKGNEVQATFYNMRKQCDETLKVQRVINCTGPETSIYKTSNPLLRKLAEKGIISADEFELGINADVSTYNILSAKGEKFPNIFTLGSNLKGLLWETIAVPELRVQCEQLSRALLKSCGQN